MNESGHVPFPSSSAICTDPLTATLDAFGLKSTTCANTPRADHNAGDPNTKLSEEIHAHLYRELGTALLDELYKKLWHVARRSGSSIDPLHTQRVKGRTIVPTEDPRLHLVWDAGRIYVKPVPVYLLHYGFWATYLQDPTPTSPSNDNHQTPRSGATSYSRSLALGFMRSYTCLLTHRLDFELAKEAHLMPDEVQDWAHWSAFIRHFRHLPDDVVARRYHFGQLRLSRLNWAVRIFQPQHASTIWYYEITYWSISDFQQRATVPMIFVFASVSVALSSMQVMLSIEPDALGSGESKRAVNWAFWVFWIVILLSWAVAWALFLGIPLVVIIWQELWGSEWRGKGGQPRASRTSSPSSANVERSTRIRWPMPRKHQGTDCWLRCCIGTLENLSLSPSADPVVKCVTL